MKQEDSSGNEPIKYSALSQEHKDLLQRVAEMYMRYGIKSVSMDDVAREAGISKKTLYQYFTDKSELVEAFIQFESSRITGIIDQVISANLDAVTEMFEIHKFMDHMTRSHSHVAEYDLKKYYPQLFQQVLQTKRNRIYSIGKNNIDKGKQEGLYRNDVNGDIIAKMNLLRYESSMDSCIFSGEELLSQDFFMEMFIFFVRGIGTPKGIEIMEKLLQK